MLPLMLHSIFVDDILNKRHRHSIFNPLSKSIPSSPLANVGIEVTSRDEEYRIEVDMPGVKPNDLDITVQEDSGRISITGIRRFKDTQGQTAKKARVSKTFSVDTAEVDLSQIRANLSDGVLVVSAPKQPKSPPRKIAVTTVPHEHKKSIEKENSTKEASEQDPTNDEKQAS